MFRIRNPKDVWSGVMFCLVGLAAVVLARNYPLGTTFKMGPGYFPTALGLLLTAIGVLSMARSLVRPGSVIEPFVWRQLAIILGSVLVFGVLLRGAGLMVAIAALVVVSALASQYSRWKTVLWLTVGLVAFSVVVFVKLLGLPMALFGPWLGG